MQPIGGDSPLEYLKAVLDLIQEKAYFSKKITNWDAVRQQARIMAGTANTTQETYPAINMVLERLGHRHSFLISADSRKWNPSQSDNVTYGFSVLRNDRRVVQVIPGSPADNADIAVGDKIVAIDDVMLRENDTLPDFDLMQRTVKLTFSCAENNEILDALLTPRMMVRDALPQGRRMGHWGYLELPGLHDEPNYDMYLRVARDTIESITGKNPARGWVIDVRRNQGGHFWSMLAAAGTLLGNGEAGTFIRNDGSEETWKYDKGAASCNDEVRASLALESNTHDYSEAPIALLHSPMTADSGEILVVAFKGRKNLRTFGKPTSGIPTLNTDFPLSDGARLQLTTAVCADRDGTVYLESIDPDVTVETDWGQFGVDDDPVISAAIKWLNTTLD